MSQSVYPTSSTKANIVSVFPPEQGGEIPGGKNQDSKRKTALSTCAIAGIAIGGAAALAAIVAVMIWLYRRKKMVEEERGYELQDTDVQHNMRHELPDDEKRHEVEAPLRHEVAGDANHKVELYANNEQEKPVEAADTQIDIYELPAHEKKCVEMEDEEHVQEKG
jgi:type III secretory pathway component EscV